MKLLAPPYQLGIKSKKKKCCTEISFYLHQNIYWHHCYSLLELFPIQIKVKIYPVLTSNLKNLHSCVLGFICFGIHAKKWLLKICCFRRQIHLRKKMNKTISKIFYYSDWIFLIICICLLFSKASDTEFWYYYVGAAPDHHII